MKSKKEPITELFNRPGCKGNKGRLAEIETELLASFLLTDMKAEK